jgi:hypothetical protein
MVNMLQLCKILYAFFNNQTEFLSTNALVKYLLNCYFYKKHINAHQT